MVMQFKELYTKSRQALLANEDPQMATMMARSLISQASGKTQEEILANPEMEASPETCRKVVDGLERLLKGEPLAYVLGEWEFYGLNLYVNSHTLIPRDDTCAVASLAINKALFLDQDPRVLDLCCGTGCIGLAIASRVKDARVTLADISREAIAVAKKNIALHKLSGRVSCVQVDALAEPPAFLGKFDLIVSNPPYITGEEMKTLPESVKDFEPHLALYGGEDGLDFYRAIVKNYSKALKPGGYLCFEFGEDQGDDICACLEANGYTVEQRVKDFNDTERAVLARYGGKEE